MKCHLKLHIDTDIDVDGVIIVGRGCRNGFLRLQGPAGETGLTGWPGAAGVPGVKGEEGDPVNLFSSFIQFYF